MINETWYKRAAAAIERSHFISHPGVIAIGELMHTVLALSMVTLAGPKKLQRPARLAAGSVAAHPRRCSSPGTVDGAVPHA